MSRRIQIIFICLAAVLLLGQRAAADAPSPVDTWDTDDQLGLPENSVIALTQTHDGWLWLGTQNGLARFDGNTFTPFNVNNTPGLPNNVVVLLFEDSRSNLWVGTGDGGLCILQNGKCTDFQTGDDTPVNSSFEDAGGTVWFRAQDGKLFSWQNGKFEARTSGVPDEFAFDFFNRHYHCVIKGISGTAWILQGDRIKFKDGTVEKDCGRTPWTADLKEVQFTSPAGIFGPRMIDSKVTAAIVDRDGNLVVGTHGEGVYWMDGADGWRHIVFDKDSKQNFILTLGFDRDGNLWAGTDGGGLYRVKKNYFGSPMGLTTGVIQSMAGDARGGLWAAVNAHGLTYVLTNTVQNFTIGIYSNAWSVLVDQKQQVWAGTRGEGLFHLESGIFQPVSAVTKVATPSIPGAFIQIFALFMGRDGKLWVGSESGLACFDGTNWEIFSPSDGLPPNPAHALAEDANGNLFIGTDGGGIFQLLGGKISSINAPVKDISCLLADHDGTLWAGTSGHGLARFTGGQWTVFSAADGLAGDDVGYLVDDGLGNLWMGTYEGLVRADKKSLADFAAGTIKKISCRTFLTRECSAGAQPAALRMDDGQLLFPTIEGVVAVNPANLPLNTNPPPVVIESVLVDGAPVQGDKVTLTPENEQLEIHFTALNFSAPKGAQFGAHFRYQLEGRDKKPTDIGGERVAHFSKLVPGNYTFRVTACNEDGVWNEAGATLAITVQPPFWRQPGFIAACVLIFIGALAGIIYLISTAKLKRQLRAARQKEIIEHERARIARDLHDQLGANLTQITLLGEMAELDKTEPAEIEQHAQQICETARETTRALDEIVWAVNPSNDTLEGLTNYACKYAQDYFALAGIRYRAELPADLPPMPILPEVRHNVFLAFKEAVNNVVKHAQASEARVKLQLEADKFILSVTDNGRGLGDLSSKSLRNGLKNMRKRLDDVRGQFEIVAGENGGTIARFTVPLKK